MVDRKANGSLSSARVRLTDREHVEAELFYSSGTELSDVEKQFQINAITAPTFMDLSNQLASPRRGTRELLRIYSDSPWLRAIVNKIGKSVAETHWLLFSATDGNGKFITNVQLSRLIGEARQKGLHDAVDENNAVKILDHPLLDLLENGTGNPRLNGFACMQLTAMHMDLVGEAFWLIEKNDLGVPESFWPLPPSWVRKLPTESNPFYELSTDGGLVGDIPASMVVPFIDPDPKDPYQRGTGISKSLDDEIQIDEYAAKHQKSFFLNRARPDIIISGQFINSEDAKRLERKWLSDHQGFWKSFKPLFFSNKIDVKELSQSFESMQMVQVRKQERDTFQQVFGIPPEKLGIVGESKRCHDEETEVLTKRGWLHHEELLEEDYVATVNPETRELVYEQPTTIHRYKHKGTMHHWTGQRFDCMVTPNHSMMVERPLAYGRSSGYQPMSSEDLASRPSKACFMATVKPAKGISVDVDIPFVGIRHLNEKSIVPEDGDTYNIPASTFAQFLGYWVSEGFVSKKSSRVGYTQNEGNLAIEMFDTLEDLGLGGVRLNEQVTCTGNNHWHMAVVNRSLKVWLQENVGFYSYEKRLPNCVWDWPEDVKRILFRALMDGDGHWGPKADRVNLEVGSSWYSTTSKQLADDVQRLAIEIGVQAILSVKRLMAYENWRTQYAVSFTNRDHHSLECPNKCITEKEYDGLVWCVTVPSGAFITRRKGKVGIHFNSTIAAADMFWTKDIIRPRVETLRRPIQGVLVPMFDKRLILSYETPVIQEDEFKLQVMRFAPWAFTLNQWQELSGQPGFGPAGDVILVPLNMQPVPVKGENGIAITPDEVAASHLAAIAARGNVPDDADQIASVVTREISNVIKETMEEVLPGRNSNEDEEE